jgi:hypothetical protein
MKRESHGGYKTRLVAGDKRRYDGAAFERSKKVLDISDYL